MNVVREAANKYMICMESLSDTIIKEIHCIHQQFRTINNRCIQSSMSTEQLKRLNNNRWSVRETTTRRELKFKKLFWDVIFLILRYAVNKFCSIISNRQVHATLNWKPNAYLLSLKIRHMFSLDIHKNIVYLLIHLICRSSEKTLVVKTENIDCR